MTVKSRIQRNVKGCNHSNDLSLSILNHVEMDSEQSVIGYGVSLILLNIGMYVEIPCTGRERFRCNVKKRTYHTDVK